MKILTEQEKKMLEPFEKWIKQAYFSHTLTEITMDARQKLRDIYIKLGYPSRCITCNYDVIEMCQTLGRLYVEAEQREAEQAKAKAEAETKKTEKPKAKPKAKAKTKN